VARHAIVVGAGIVGACCAGWLQKKGLQVTLVERDGPGEATSFGNAGSLSPTAVLPVAMPGMVSQIPGWLLDPLGPLVVRWPYLPRALPWLVRFIRCANPEAMWRTGRGLWPLLQPIFECYEPLVRNANCEDLIRREGCLYVYDSEADFKAARLGEEMRRALGAVLEDVAESDLRRMEPGLAPRFRWARYAPENGYTIDPHRLTKAIAGQVVADGGRLVRADAKSIASRGGRAVLRTSEGEIDADAVVVAAGAWSHRLAASVGDRIPLESQRGYHVTLANPKVQAGRMMNWMSRRVFATPMAMGMRFAGTVEIAGLDAEPNWERAGRLLALAQEMFPGIDASNVSRWMGHRPCLPDSLPVIGPSPRAKGVYYAFGHGHVGMCSASGTGRTIAELVAGEAPQVDVSPFRADRF